MFFSEYCEIFKNNYFEEHLQTAASGGIHLPPVPMTVFFKWKQNLSKQADELFKDSKILAVADKLFESVWLLFGVGA